MNVPVDPARLFAGKLPLAYRLSERAPGWFGGATWQMIITRLVRHRSAPHDGEWQAALHRDPYRVEVQFLAPRVPLRFLITIKGQFTACPVRVSAWVRDEWRSEPIQHFWSTESGATKLVVLLNRMVLTPRLMLDFNDADVDYEILLEPRVARYHYVDLYHVARARQAIQAQSPAVAEAEYKECLAIVPNHIQAAEELARLYLDLKNLVQTQRWALCATVASDGRRGRDLLTQAIAAGASDLAAEVAQLRADASSWVLGRHHGAVCLKYQQQYWLGFDFLHMVRRRKILDIRRKAAARLLHTIRFRFAPHNEALQFARLRVLGVDGTIQEVPKEQLAFIDSPENDASIFTEEWKEAVYTLPELESGEALELEYVVLHSNRMMKDGRPEFFIKADLNMEFPVWESQVRIDCPRGWDVQCITTNGAAPPGHLAVDEDWQAYQAVVHGLAYDSWATESQERGLRSPHVCCSWAGRDWPAFAHERREFYENLPVEEVPAPLAAAMAAGDTPEEKLRRAFEWIRDRLKYASLPSAKKRIGKFGTAAQIIAAGVGDCVDRAYLLRLVANELGLESEYALAATRLAPVVKELPAEQFDHVFLRVRLNDRWLCLDGTSAPTPFGHAPLEQQGTSVLSLGPATGLIEIPEDDPSQNRITITESLVCDDEHGIGGVFDINAVGILGRLFDNRWKGSSMSYEDPDRAAKLALREHLSSAKLTDWRFHSEGTVRDTFELSGHHRRNTLEEMGNRRFGMFEWQFQTGIPVDAWKERIWKDVAIFPLTLTNRLELSIQPSPGWRIEAHSPITTFDSEFGSIIQDEHWDGPTLCLTRQVTVKKRRVFGSDVERMPEFLSAFEKAQRLTVMFGRE